MTQSALSFDQPAETMTAPRLSKLEKVRRLFQRSPYVWINANEIAAVGGRLSSRTRVSELRQPRHGQMNIRNRTYQVDGETHSEYRYEP
jgi:hypothetical protein